MASIVRPILRLAPASLALVALACGHGAPPPATVTTTTSAQVPAAPAVGADVCPLGVPDSEIVGERTEDGALLQFTTSGSPVDVRELRHRVHQLALRGAIEPTTPEFHMEVRDTEHGARLTVRAENAGEDEHEVEMLRDALFASGRRMAMGECVRAGWP
jgi:hypothetical protein